ncbi:N amino acid transport system protein [Stemphylium lycopersici]|nr:amino acid transporter [Stemphylium lycopersici]RAR11602.1 N amino acid transport system protein [Stemphylium lycopersici]
MADLRARGSSAGVSSTSLNQTNNRATEKATVHVVGEPSLRQRLTASSDLEGQFAPAAQDDTFGNEEGAEIQYKTCAWWNTGILMLAENVSLGILALPQALAILGIVPALLLIVLLGLIATYTGYLIGEFKLAYPSLQSYADCGTLISGPIARDVIALGQVMVLIFIMGAHILTFAVAMNAMTNHATCTIIFSVIGFILSFLLGLPRTFKNVSYLSIFSCASIILSVTVTMIAIGIQKPDMDNMVGVRPNASLVTGLNPVMNIVLAYTGHVAFFSFASELKDPRKFRKALFFEQGIAVSFYAIISAVIYFFAGPLVASPALGSASPLISKICFGIALPTIIVAGVVNGSVATKYVYLRIWKASWILAEAVPNFNLLLGLIGALFGSWFSYALPPLLWLWHDRKNGKLFSSKRQCAFTVINFSIMILGVSIFGLGMWSSGSSLHNGSGGNVFSCENNWHPVSWVAEGTEDN